MNQIVIPTVLGTLGMVPKMEEVKIRRRIKTIQTRGARGVMVIITGYGHSDTSSNP